MSGYCKNIKSILEFPVSLNLSLSGRFSFTYKFQFSNMALKQSSKVKIFQVCNSQVHKTSFILSFLKLTLMPNFLFIEIYFQGLRKKRMRNFRRKRMYQEIHQSKNRHITHFYCGNNFMADASMFNTELFTLFGLPLNIRKRLKVDCVWVLYVYLICC